MTSLSLVLPLSTGLPPGPALDMLARAAREAALLAVGCCICGSVDLESWDGGRTFHCFVCKQKSPVADQARIEAERRAIEAARQVDKVDAPTPEANAAMQLRFLEQFLLCFGPRFVAHGGRSFCCSRGVTLGFLKAFEREHTCGALKTSEVVRDVIKPLTRNTRCRFVELPDVAASGSVQQAVLFVSHTWGAPFGFLLAALRRLLFDCDSVAVWLDIFAVSPSVLFAARCPLSR